MARRPSASHPPAHRKGRQPAAARGASAIDEYLAALSEDRRKALQALRQVIRAALPMAEECISYGIPAFRFDGKVVAGFAATKKGCSYFPFSGSTLRTLAQEVVAYEQTKSSLHFSAEEPLPKTLVRKLLRARLAELRRARRPGK